jgi:hypothetical protein
MTDMLTPEVPSSASFETRRHAVWRGSRRWLFCTALCCALAVVMLAAGGRGELAWVLVAASVALVAVTANRIVRGLDRLYRCPNCGTLPYQTLTDYKCGGLGPSRSDFMSPRICPSCGTRLR